MRRTHSHLHSTFHVFATLALGVVAQACADTAPIDTPWQPTSGSTTTGTTTTGTTTAGAATTGTTTTGTTSSTAGSTSSTTGFASGTTGQSATTSGDVVAGDGGAGLDPDASPGTTDAGADASFEPSTELCQLHGYEIAMVGDSYINLTGLASVLADITHASGALPANEEYVDVSVSGASMDGFPNIPDQWPGALEEAKRRGAEKIKLVIMTGGGNDVLVNNRYCLDFPTLADVSEECKQVVDTALQRGQEVVDQSAADGVEHAIYFYYPHLPEFSLGGGPYPNTILDYALPLLREFCETQTALKCHFIDMVPPFDGGNGFPRDGLISLDGIHPSAEGTQLMAEEIWDKMQEQCLGSMPPG